MPANRFSLAVRVSGKDKLIRTPKGSGDIFHPLAALFGHLPAHFKVIIGLNRTVFRGQITHMTIRSEDLVVIAKILINGFGFCR